MTDLATAEDVEEFLGRDLTSEESVRVVPILAKLSDLFREASGQLFTPGESEVRLRVNGGRVYLPQRPVVAVESVLDDRNRAVTYTRHGQWLTVRCHGFVVVKYMHGAEAVPDGVRGVIADAARQVLAVSPDAVHGVTQTGTTAGPFSTQHTYASWASGGSARLSPEDLSYAKTFRLKVAGTWSAK
jgi:hypothetical protein